LPNQPKGAWLAARLLVIFMYPRTRPEAGPLVLLQVRLAMVQDPMFRPPVMWPQDQGKQHVVQALAQIFLR
jgi:hypothetical protein